MKWAPWGIVIALIIVGASCIKIVALIGKILETIWFWSTENFLNSLSLLGFIIALSYIFIFSFYYYKYLVKKESEKVGNKYSGS